MDFSSICRTCLDNDSLNPIFKDNDDHVKYCNAIYIATGLQVQYNDNLPQNMCTTCISKLNDALQFRKQCREAKQLLLIQTKSEKLKNESTIISINKPYSQQKDTINNEATSGPTIKVELIDFELKSYADDEKTMDTTIKIEFNDTESKNKIDIDDDLPLKLLITSVTSDTKLFHTQEDTLNYFENPHVLSDVDKSEDERDEKELNVTLTDDLKNIHYNYLQLQSSTVSSVTKTSNEVDIPYELLIDSASQKASRVLCKLCNKELSIRSIDLHMSRRHPGADERKVKCEMCDSYVLKNKLNRHMKLVHGNESFRCLYCKSEFDNKELLVDHVDTCTAKKKKRKSNESGRELGECDECHKVMQKASLRMHKAVKHAGLKPVCEHCGKCFGNKFRLKEHYRAKHGYEKFQCKYCDFRSAGAMAMRNHERRHLNEKPFICEECGAKFHAAYLLAQHRHSHRTQKLIKCDLCPASFKANNSLHMHKLTCHSKLNYKCAICCRSYKCRHYALKHVRHVHKYNGPTPPLSVVHNGEIVEKTT